MSDSLRPYLNLSPGLVQTAAATARAGQNRNDSLITVHPFTIHTGTAAGEAALGKISPMYRVIVVLRDVEGQTYEEIAETTGLALGTVKSRLHKGRAILQKILERYR